jgi:hypothetical protein
MLAAIKKPAIDHDAGFSSLLTSGDGFFSETNNDPISRTCHLALHKRKTGDSPSSTQGALL